MSGPRPAIPVIDTDRGGKITWHGPGQLVGYPIIGLAEPLDVVNFVRRLEESLIAVCAGLGLETGRVAGRSGVWVPADGIRPARKVGAIGVRVSRATTLHGFALNCDCDLDAFSSIVPCGISDAGVTSLTAELGHRVGVDDVMSRVADAVCDALGRTTRSSIDTVTVTRIPMSPARRLRQAASCSVWKSATPRRRSSASRRGSRPGPGWARSTPS